MSDQNPYAELETNYRKTKERIRADEDLSYEAKQRKIREAGLVYDRERREIDKRVLERLEAEEERAYRKAYGPGRSTLSAEQETARELRLARIRAEVTDTLRAGRDEPLIAYERAVRAGDSERALVIGKVGEKYLREPARRQRIRQLVAENEPAETKRAKRRLAQIEIEAHPRTGDSPQARHPRPGEKEERTLRAEQGGVVANG
jgi:hypothetical protein